MDYCAWETIPMCQYFNLSGRYSYQLVAYIYSFSDCTQYAQLLALTSYHLYMVWVVIWYLQLPCCSELQVASYTGAFHPTFCLVAYIRKTEVHKSLKAACPP